MTDRIILPASTRRQFLYGTAALGSMAVLGAPRGALAQEKPRRGGTLRVAMGPGNTSDSLDPATYTDSPQYTMGFTLGNCLVEIDSSKMPIPELAESWESSADFKEWRFQLRKGVQFHNGKELSSADVVYSLSRHIAPDSKSAAKGLLSDVTSIKADGATTVVVTHKTGTPDLPVLLGDFHLQIVPENFTDWANFIGTGPYKLSRFDPGVVLETVRNENYWKPDRAWVDKFELAFINDEAAATNALITGDVQGISKVSPQIARRLESNGSIQLVKSDGAYTYHIDMNALSKTFASNDVRLAVKHAIDRQKMLEFVGGGYGVLGNDHPVPPNDPYYNPEIKQRAYDPEKAKFHLKKAGLSKLDLTLHVSDAAYSGAVDSAALFQETARASGINIDIKREPADGYWVDIWLKKDFMIAIAGVRPTPDMMFSIFFQCGAPWNESFWCDDRFTKLLVAGRQTNDFAKRKEIYSEMQQLLHDEGAEVIFMFPPVIDCYSSTVKGLVPDGVRSMMGARVAERAWLEG